MTILITSGGTIVKIDDVRHIANFSSGEFLSQIAEEALLAGHKVIYLHAKRAKKPFESKFIFDPTKPSSTQFSKIEASQKQFLKVKKNLECIEFQTFDEYSNALKNILSKRDIDITFLGAAVSDYGMSPVKGKISSAKNELVLKLRKNGKVIEEVKKWSKKPLFQVGFKLLSGVDTHTLTETAYKSGLDNRSDLTIANDLEKIRSGNREIFAVTPEKGVLHMGGKDIAKKLVDFVLKRANTHHFKTIVTTDKKLPETYKREFELFKGMCNLLYRKNLMTPFYEGSTRSHGSLALKVNKGLLITSRGSNKENLKPDDIVLVSKIDWKNGIIEVISSSQTKASLNAPLIQKIFDSYPNVNAVVHTHSFDLNHPTTDFAETPGTLEYALGPIKLLKKSEIVNLKDHGLIVVGDDLIEATQKVLKSEIIKGNCYHEFPEFYDLLYKRYLKTIPDFVNLVVKNTANDSHILDLAAGTGEVSIPLLEYGFKVSSLDQSKGMLEQLKKKAGKKAAKNLTTFVRDLNQIDLENTFDTVCIRQAVNYYMNPTSLENGFKSIALLLNKGGKFIFNAPNFKIGTEEYKPTHGFYDMGNLTASTTESNVLKDRMLNHKQTALVWNEDIETKMISDSNAFYMYTKEEFESALKKVGFRSIKFLSSGLKAYNKNDKTLYCVATK